jgi:16S rRNA (cytidine1402-2'-O)-methyltransferase
LSASGVSAPSFTFLGFIPHKKGREKIFKEIANSDKIVAFYESTHRIIKTLESLNTHCPLRTIILAKELTKQFENFLEGKPKDLIEKLTEDKSLEKGEFVVIVKLK